MTLGLPEHFKPETVEKIYAGMNALAKKHGVAIVGGETTANPERIFISVALLGTVPRGKQILRSGAKAGDAIFVTGELGGSPRANIWILNRAWPRRAGWRSIFPFTP